MTFASHPISTNELPIVTLRLNAKAALLCALCGWREHVVGVVAIREIERLHTNQEIIKRLNCWKTKLVVERRCALVALYRTGHAEAAIIYRRRCDMIQP